MNSLLDRKYTVWCRSEFPLSHTQSVPRLAQECGAQLFGMQVERERERDEGRTSTCWDTTVCTFLKQEIRDGRERLGTSRFLGNKIRDCSGIHKEGGRTECAGGGGGDRAFTGKQEVD